MPSTGSGQVRARTNVQASTFGAVPRYVRPWVVLPTTAVAASCRAVDAWRERQWGACDVRKLTHGAREFSRRRIVTWRDIAAELTGYGR